ncbi:AAA family ATPase [Granulicella sp. WH15]|uniref:AAA family ATPase n=1 Tax=Granulicella sp. WH15 TaxID=2602070 RepID=UPI001367394F|nr:AAA family ATPase [Granulicella sp. WH15]QHN04399.1 AAA family ATPase [Granulicella sp. WH15]
MKIRPEVLEQLEASTPSTEAVQKRVREYLAVAQLTIDDFARRVGRGHSGVKIFLSGKYITSTGSSSDVRIRRALVEFMDAHPIEISTQTNGKLYETSNVRVMREWFDRCRDGREMAVIYGPPGSQKTFVFSHLIAEHNRRELSKNGHGSRAYYVYCSQNITPRELLKKMAKAAAIPATQSIAGIINALSHHLASRKSIFVLDEAQHLGIPTLEIVRELNDCAPRCGVLLAGSHSLMRLFHERAAELEQWNARLSNAIELPGIAAPEATAIVEAELGVQPAEKLKMLLDHSRVTDGFSRKKQQYLSAHRIFRQIKKIKAHPLFIAPNTTQKESAA